MFSVIQYTDFCDDVIITPHGLSQDLQSAKAFASNLILADLAGEFGCEGTFFSIIDNSYTQYVSMADSPTAKLICTMRGNCITLTTEEDRVEIMGYIKNNHSEDGPITVASVLKYYQCIEVDCELVAEEFPLDEAIEENAPRQVELMDCLRKYGIQLSDDERCFDEAIEVFAIVEMSVVTDQY